MLTRYVRSAVLDVLREDYLRTARAQGAPAVSALWRHGLRNAAVPVVTVLGLQLATLLIGAVVVERVFVIPGLGSLLLDGVSNRDLLLVQDVVMFLVVAVLVVNFLVDLLYVALDPRLRVGNDERRACQFAVRRGVGSTRVWSSAALIVLVIVLMALVSFVWTPYDATLVDPAVRLAKPSWSHWFGTDKFGRDLFSQIMVGSRTTLVRRPRRRRSRRRDRRTARNPGRDDSAAGRANSSCERTTCCWRSRRCCWQSCSAAVFGASTLTAMVAIGIATVPSFARIIRSGALQVMRTEYVLAARAAGRKPFAIALRHVLPNVTSLITVQASVSFAIAVLAEAALSFLGYGTPPPTPSWGRMLQESQEFLFSAPRLAVFPGVAIAIAVLGFNLLGDGLRDRFDPKLDDRR